MARKLTPTELRLVREVRNDIYMAAMRLHPNVYSHISSAIGDSVKFLDRVIQHEMDNGSAEEKGQPTYIPYSIEKWRQIVPIAVVRKCDGVQLVVLYVTSNLVFIGAKDGYTPEEMLNLFTDTQGGALGEEVPF